LLGLRGVTEGPLFELFQSSMLFSNDETHRNRRSPLTRQFAFRVVEELRPKIRQQAANLLNHTARGGTLDIRDRFGALLPAHTIALILGIDPGDIPYFTHIVYCVARSLGHTWTQEDLPDLNAAAAALADYVERLIKERRVRPRDDFMSDYIRAVDAAGNLSVLEEIHQLVTLIIGGSDTTRAAMVILVSLLLQNPHQLQAVREDANLIPSAVMESLRYEPSVGSVTRFTIEDIVLDGHTVEKGSIASLSTLSALRDPERYQNPDSFDIYQDRPKWHTAFGGGPHRCLGEALSKVELEEGLAALLRAMPHMQVVGDHPRVHGHAGIRRVGELVVAGRV